ncbi:hypothetical protein [Corynebacterium mastitidis]
MDPFAGSGTTNLVAQERGVYSVSAEVHPKVHRTVNAKLH